MSTPTITSLGVGTNGLDLESLLSKQVAAESQPLNDLNAQTQTLQTQLSALGQVQSTLSALHDAAATLTDPSTWGATQSSSSDATSVAVTSDSTAPVGSVSVAVSQLATAQTVASNTFANTTDSVGDGTLTIQLGTWSADGSSFTAKSGANPVTVTISAGNDSLTNIRDQINAASAGVTASIVTDSSGSRLVMTSNNTGVSSGFKVSASGTSGLAALAYDPSSGTTGMTQKLAASNAQATVNGLDINSESNTLTTVISGLTINLLKPTTGVQLNVTQDTAAMKTNIQAFVTAYNNMATLLANDTKYDSGSKTAGTLQGDNTTTDLEEALRGLGGSSTNLAGAFTRLADIGLDPIEDGTLQVNDSKLTSALANPANLKQFFMGIDKTNANNDGLAQQIMNFSEQALSIDGSLTTHQSGVQTEINNNNQQAQDMQASIDLYSQRLRDRYNALDTQMSQLNSLSSYVSQQMAQLNGTTSK
ncbi:MAG: flagellar filament capping protein FliD [Paucibacter sp.]|nr:flagellar filament capping protein FliD [Roseateles sp.]